MTETVAFSKHSANVFFHILTKCNLQCSHCYINPKQHGSQTLSLETIITWLEIFINKAKKANLILLGGEPTLHPQLDVVVKSARKMGYASITIDTNGYLFNNILDKLNHSDIDFLSFSLDGATKETNDQIRGNGCYDKCISGIKEAVSKGFHTSLIFTVSSENVHELSMMPQMLNSLGIERFFIQVIGIRGKSANVSDRQLQVDQKTWQTLIPEVANKAASFGITVTYPKVFLEQSGQFECAGQVADNYFIFPNGRVYRCPLCEDYALHSFKIKNNQLISRPGINEQDLFGLCIPEGCVINKLVQSGNLAYREDGTPEYQIACCLLKEEISARQ